MTGPTIAIGPDRAHVAVPVDLNVYSVDAAMRTAYKFTDRCFVWLQRDSPERLMVYLLGRTAATDLGPLALDFSNELVDQQLRCRLEDNFQDIRTLIVAQAFSEGNLLTDVVDDDGDYKSDLFGTRRNR